MTDIDTSADAFRGVVSLLRNMATQLLHSERARLADIIDALAAERDALKQRLDVETQIADEFKGERDRLAAENARLLETGLAIESENSRLREENALLRRAWLRVIQSENYCAPTGAACQAKRCRCAAEMELYINEAKEIALTGVIETIPCSPHAEASINAAA